ncbi:MAG: type II secretion system protein GspM [Gammaproteobacteria bacterium]|nr:type II secretion system protein GspM [Gammaproteobacteria bacterium]
MKDQLLDYWNGLETRERRVLVLGGVVVALTLLYLAAFKPMMNYRAGLESNVERKRDTVAWMQGAVKILAQRPAPANRGNVDTGSLLTLVDSSARNALLGSAMKRVQQNGEKAVRVRFEAASFDDLLLWLGGLQQQYGVAIEDFTLERADAPGRVDASITLTRGTG